MTEMEPTSRTERLLVAMLLQSMKGDSLKDKVRLLNMAGFSNIDIANLLDTTSDVVAHYVYEIRKTKKKTRG
jgi:hypothetical protein